METYRLLYGKSHSIIDGMGFFVLCKLLFFAFSDELEP